MENFKLFGGKKIPNLGEYVKEYIKNHPEAELYIGTDSANKRRHTTYVSVVCFLHPNKGVHVIFRRTRKKKIRRNRKDYAEIKTNTNNTDVKKYWKETLFPRMWNEVQDSADLALYLKDYTYKKIIVDLDLNPRKEHQSNIAHDAALGYIKSLGFIARTKPDAWAASCAADLIANK